MRHKQMPYVHSHQHPSRERFARGTSARPWVHLPDQLCCPEVAPQSSHSRVATRQCRGCFLSHHPGKLPSLAGSPSVSGIPASSQFNPFLQRGLLALRATSFLRHKLPLLSTYSLNFPFTLNYLTCLLVGLKASLPQGMLHGRLSKAKPAAQQGSEFPLERGLLPLLPFG